MRHIQVAENYSGNRSGLHDHPILPTCLFAKKKERFSQPACCTCKHFHDDSLASIQEKGIQLDHRNKYGLEDDS